MLVDESITERPVAAADEHSEPSGNHLEIALISFAALVLEIAFTRVVSFKLFYYYTYFVIGLALLGLGAGAVQVAISKRLQRASTNAILGWGSLVTAGVVIASYLVVARLGIASLRIWEYGSRASFSSLARLIVICLALFAPFAGIGVMIATLFGRRTDKVASLYFADLLGAAIACGVAVSLIWWLGPPKMILGAAVVLCAVAARAAWSPRRGVALVLSAVAIALGVVLLAGSALPDVKTDDIKGRAEQAQVSRWSPIFRVDAIGTPPPPGYTLPRTLLLHDGTLGSIIQPWDGKRSSLTAFEFDRDPRSFPFKVLGRDRNDVMIIGAAGGHEILASLYFNSRRTDAIELNPATFDLVTKDYADYDGHLADAPGVHYVNGDGRSYLARNDRRYDLVWYPAPDSYSATNAATAGAFVLSESYLYTAEAIEDSLRHLRPDGLLAAQFGEIDFDHKPNRTARYVSTARQALEQLGLKDPAAHVLVSTASGTQSTVLVKRSPFTAAEVARFTSLDQSVPGTELRYAPGNAVDPRIGKVLTLSGDKLANYLGSQSYDLSPIDDNAPFFWHFARFGTVARNYFEPIVGGTNPDYEDSVGERVLLLELGIAAALAAAFLLAPFVLVRRTWRSLPHKANSAAYFALLGLGFMFFEIALVQRFTLFLGFPTYSLTVTLASLLVFTGIGSLSSGRIRHRPERVLRWLAPGIVALAAFYLAVLPRLTDALLGAPLGVRFLTTFVVLAPLGLCLGLFMPLGLRTVAELVDGEPAHQYVAWSWAVNGFASVIGSVLTTIVAMSYGFDVVLVLAAVVYLLALAALWRLRRTVPRITLP